jgi:uncharacterized protein (TIGR02246 family)
MRLVQSRLPIVAFALAACAAPATEQPAATAAATPDPAAVRAAIDAINTSNMEAMNSGDSARTMGMMAHYEDGAIVMLPGMPAMNGKAAIEQGLGGMLASMKLSDARFSTIDVIISGDYAIETGTFQLSMTPKGGKAAPDKGKYLTVWHKQADGSWKIVRDINNSDTAPPAGLGVAAGARTPSVPGTAP